MEKKLMRSPDKKLCGVCSGIADYFNVDPTLIRIGVALLSLYTVIVPALLAYFIVALIMPKAPENYYQFVCNTSKRLMKGHDKKVAGVCSGVAERFDFDATIVRVIFILLVLLFGTGLLAYIVCACIMPSPVDNDYQPNYYGQPNNQGFAGGQPYQEANYTEPQTPPQPNFNNEENNN